MSNTTKSHTAEQYTVTRFLIKFKVGIETRRHFANALCSEWGGWWPIKDAETDIIKDLLLNKKQLCMESDIYEL